jgi:plastocyanin
MRYSFTAAGIVVSAALLSGSALSAPGAGETATLTGTVTLGAKLKPRAARVNLYLDVAEGIPATRPASLAAEMANVVLSIDGPGLSDRIARPAAAPAPLRIEQKHATFIPHVLPVLRGAEVEFPNGDPFFHNVFSLSRAASFDLGRYGRSATRSVRFDTPGVVKVFCHIHADMSAVVVVLDNPLFTVPDAEGRFAIQGVPPGTWTVTAWHERARPIRRKITFDAGQAVDTRFDIPLEEQSVEE